MQQDPTIRDPFDRISADQAKEMIDAGGVTVIDVREAWEWNQGHITPAVHAPLGALLSNPREHLNEDNVIFVCAEGIRSAVACEVAAAVGLTKIYNLEGGTNAWASKGYPMTK